MAEKILGFEGKLYYCSGGQVGTFTELTNCRDVNIKRTKEVVDTTTRADVASRYRTSKVTWRSCEITFDMILSPSDPAYLSFSAAWEANTVMGIRAIPASGETGIEGDFNITDFSNSQKMSDASIIEVTLQPAATDTPIHAYP